MQTLLGDYESFLQLVFAINLALYTWKQPSDGIRGRLFKSVKPYLTSKVLSEVDTNEHLRKTIKGRISAFERGAKKWQKWRRLIAAASALLILILLFVYASRESVDDCMVSFILVLAMPLPLMLMGWLGIYLWFRMMNWHNFNFFSLIAPNGKDPNKAGDITDDFKKRSSD